MLRRWYNEVLTKGTKEAEAVALFRKCNVHLLARGDPDALGWKHVTCSVRVMSTVTIP
jgi:hypothetical protein